MFFKIVVSHPITGFKKMSFCIFLRSTCEFRLKMRPIYHLSMNYLRARLIWKRLQWVWDRHCGTSRVSWGRLIWSWLMWHRLIGRRLLWSRLTSRCIIGISLGIIVGVCRIWCYWTFYSYSKDFL